MLSAVEIKSNSKNGYIGRAMSIHAAEAYLGGEMPKSKWTKKAMLSAIADYCGENGLAFDGRIEGMRKDELFFEFFHMTSWHHTGRFYAETAFYGIDGNAVSGCFPKMTDEQIEQREKMRRIQIEKELTARRAQEAKEAKGAAAHAAYRKKHGFDPRTFAAYAAEHPEKCRRRVSKRGNAVLVADFDGEDHECALYHADASMLRSARGRGYDATE